MQPTHGMIGQPAQPNNVVVSNSRIERGATCRSLLGQRLQLGSALDCRQQQRIRIGVEAKRSRKVIANCLMRLPTAKRLSIRT